MTSSEDAPRAGSPSAACRRSSSSPRGAPSRPGPRTPSPRTLARGLHRAAHLEATPLSVNVHRSGNSSTFARRRTCRSPAMLSAPFATQGVVTGPSLTRPIAASSQSPSAVRPCSQIQRSACWAPQLWPAIPASRRRRSTARRPRRALRNAPRAPARAASCAAAPRGTSTAPGDGTAAPRRLDAELPGGLVPDRPACPVRADPGRPHSSQSPPPASGPGTVELRRPRPVGREQREPQRPVGAAPGRLCTVYLIHAPSGSDGWQSFR